MFGCFRLEKFCLVTSSRLVRCDTSNISHAFTELSCTVRIISSSFCHISKSHRPHVSSFDGIDYTLLSSPGYSSNVSIGRLFDHLILAFSLIRFLCFKRFQKPGFVFIGFPPIECSLILVLWCRLHKIPHTLDVKDMWPSIFSMHKPPLFLLLLSSSVSLITPPFFSHFLLHNLLHQLLMIFYPGLNLFPQ